MRARAGGGVGRPLPTSGPRIPDSQVCVRARKTAPSGASGTEPRDQAAGSRHRHSPGSTAAPARVGGRLLSHTATARTPPATTTAPEAVRVLQNCIYRFTTWASANSGRNTRTLQLPETLTPAAPAPDKTCLRQLHFPVSSANSAHSSRKSSPHTLQFPELRRAMACHRQWRGPRTTAIPDPPALQHLGGGGCFRHIPKNTQNPVSPQGQGQ